MSQTILQRAGATALFLVGSAIAPSPFDAQTLSVASRDNPLVIRGRIDADTDSFRGNVRLTATGGDVENLRLLASELVHQTDPATAIDRSKVTIPDGTSLAAGEPRDVVVSVDDVRRPGEYRGTIRFMMPGAPADAGVQVPLRLEIGEAPQITPVRDAHTLTVVKCSPGFSCWMARFLVPTSELAMERSIVLENQARVPVEVTRVVTDVRGNHNGQALGAPALAFGLPRTLAAETAGPIDLTIQADGVAPDVYQGSVRFRLADSRDSVPVTLTLNVRDGPLLPILVVFIGIGVGRLARRMQAPEAKMQVKLFPRWRSLGDRARSIQDPTARTEATRRLAAFEGRLDRADETEEALTGELDGLEALIGLLVDLDELAASVAAVPEVTRKKLLTGIASARASALGGRLDEARSAMQDVEVDLKKAEDDNTMGVLADAFTAVRAALGRGTSAIDKIDAAASRQSRRPSHPWLAGLLGFLAGEYVQSAKVKYWLFRPLLFVTLLIVLVAIGLQTLYANNPSFGSAGLYDYLGIILWGLGADVAQATLQSLPGASNG